MDSNIDEYKTSSCDFYKQASKIKSKLLKSDMCQSYSKLYIKHHLGDMSIFFEERKSNKDEETESTSYFIPESSVAVTTDENAGIIELVNKLKDDIKLKESELREIIKVRDIQLIQYKQQVDELISNIQIKEDKIVVLQQQLEETNSIKEESKNEEVKQNHKSDEVLSRLAQDFGTIIDLMDTDEKLSTFVSELVPTISEVKEQLNDKVDGYGGLCIDMNEKDDKNLMKLLKYIKITNKQINSI